MNKSNRVLVLGATGSIGSAVVDWFIAQQYEVIAISRNRPETCTSNNVTWLQWDRSENINVFSELKEDSINAVVWAQGANFNDDIITFDVGAHQSMYEANVVYILLSLQMLIKKNILSHSARLCVISSIWQNLARQNKLSYCITKSALQGLVQSLTIDLGKSGHMINAVLPGALDTPMTRANLDEQQLRRLEEMTPLGSLSTLDDVCNLVGFLCSQNNTGITGQFIVADGGFSYARII
jgi:NAD(P)-dependent dehydrogenase (short-subunit alcohol dehydrogenase family)